MTASPPHICLFTCVLWLAWFLTPHFVQAEFTGKVVGVIDGDSIRVMHDGTAEQIRLLGIDCLERRQPFGTRAKEYTSELAFGKNVTVYGDTRDHYGRRLAEVLLPDGRSLNQELITAGLAWWFRKYSKDLRLGELERQARVAKRGLWAEPQPGAAVGVET
jgi:endonuclease YncB( thermonuclease family)